MKNKIYHKELLSLKKFIEQYQFTKYKCEYETSKKTNNPQLRIVIPVDATEEFQDDFFSHFKDVLKHYELSIRRLELGDCFFIKKQLNYYHNGKLVNKWNSELSC